MIEFEYRGVDHSGAAVEGRIEATDRRSAVSALVARGHFATMLEDVAAGVAGKTPRGEVGAARAVGVPSLGRRVSGKDVVQLMTQLSAALKAGLPLMSALEVIAQQTEKPALRRQLDAIMSSVSGGESLSDAMAQHPGVFTPLSCAMVRVGETGGILEQTSTQLSGILKRDMQIRGRLFSASIYPLSVLGLGLVSVVFIVTVILPRIVVNITGGQAGLPWPTAMLMNFGDAVRDYGWIALLLLVAGVYLFGRWIGTPAGRGSWDRIKISTPVFGKVLKTVAVGRFARTLGSLTQGGVTILEALAVVRDTLGNTVLAGAIDRAAEQVKTGQPLGTALAQSGLFPPLLVQIVGVGERTGQLDALLLNAADTFDEAADEAIGRFMTLLPIVLIVLLAVVVGFIIFASLLPILDMDLGVGL